MLVKNFNLFFILLASVFLLSSVRAQNSGRVDLSHFKKDSKVKVNVTGDRLDVSWPAEDGMMARLVFSLTENTPLFKSISLEKGNSVTKIASDLHPEFLMTIGKRDLISQNGWNIFFDKVFKKPYQAYRLQLQGRNAALSTSGSRTIIKIGEITAKDFRGVLEITLYNYSSLFNVAAAVMTQTDSTAIIYDAGLTGKGPALKKIGWFDTNDTYVSKDIQGGDSSTNVAVKYRAITAESANGSIAVFPAPHQYFYPLDEAFNLSFTWYGPNYRNLINEYGIGIRQDLKGDNRWVPWFNAPPGTIQKLNFFCLLGKSNGKDLLEQVKKYTHSDQYKKLDGFKTMASHFHNEYVMNNMMKGKASPGTPEFVSVFKKTGIDIVHLAEFHYTAHPRGPYETRLAELDSLFKLCKEASDPSFLLLPGEEPNEFFGGHWLELFPRPVYWIMSRAEGKPFVEENSKYGKIYHIGDKADMLRLLELENGIAWTAHPRTKGSTGFPDKYKDEPFFRSEHFLGAAWKAIPADLSQPRLGKRVFDLLDDMNNWGLKKKVIAEADLFSVTHHNEMYAHLNVNYLRLPKLPRYNDGWGEIIDVLRVGRFFSSTGEVLIPEFTVNGKGSGETVSKDHLTNAEVRFKLHWTFPLSFAEIISGDGKTTFRQRVDLSETNSFGDKTYTVKANLAGRKWARLEVWDVASNGAFTQSVYFE